MNLDGLYANFKQSFDEVEDQSAPFFAKASKEELANLTAVYDICCANSSVWKFDFSVFFSKDCLSRSNVQ